MPDAILAPRLDKIELQLAGSGNYLAVYRT
jgi:hypothetical protein